MLQSFKNLFGVGRSPYTVGQQITRGILMIFVVIMLFMVCTVYGYQWGTGTFPFGSTGQIALPPEMALNTTAAEVLEFVEADPTDIQEYGEGFNCVEFALLTAREAHWAGIPAEVVKVDFSDGFSHMILGYPTIDGWLFVDAQSDVVMQPRVGSELGGRTITGLYLLGITWTPLEEVNNE